MKRAARAHTLTYPKTFRARRIAANGTKLYVRVGGRGPAVILLHGYGETGDMWVPLARDLAREISEAAGTRLMRDTISHKAAELPELRRATRAFGIHQIGYAAHGRQRAGRWRHVHEPSGGGISTTVPGWGRGFESHRPLQ